MASPYLPLRTLLQSPPGFISASNNTLPFSLSSFYNVFHLSIGATERFVVLKTGVLHIYNIQLDDAGSYRSVRL